MDGRACVLREGCLNALRLQADGHYRDLTLVKVLLQKVHPRHPVFSRHFGGVRSVVVGRVGIPQTPIGTGAPARLFP